MDYGIFNLESGNLIDSLESEREALELVARLLDEQRTDPEKIGLIVADAQGHTVLSLHGRALADRIHASGGIEAELPV